MQSFSRILLKLPTIACVVALGACSNFRQQSFDIFAAEPPNAKTIDASATMLRLADKAYEKGEYGMAAQLYFRIAEQAPDTPKVTVKLGFALLKAGSAAHAEKIFRAALEKEPKNAQALRGLGHVLVIQKRPAEALPVYRQAIAASAKPDAHIYAGFGAALDMVGKHDEARAAYAAGLLLAPQDFGLRNNLAISYALSGDTAKAKEILAGLAQNPARPPKVSESLSTVQAIEASLARRMPARKRRVVAAAPQAVRPPPVRAAARATRREVVEVTAPIHVARISRKANADLPMANGGSSEIFIRTGRASTMAAEARRRPAMSFRSDADTPEEAAAEVLALLEQAARGPRFVWQQAQRPGREQKADRK